MLKIAFISQPEYFRFMYENEIDQLGTIREFAYNFSMTEKDFSDLETFGADVNFFFRGEFFPESVLKRLKGIKVNLSSEPFPNHIGGRRNYFSDSVRRYEEFRAIRGKSFDYIFHYDRSSLEFLEKDGMLLSGEFCFPVAIGVYKKIELEKKWDFFFIGRSTRRRERFITPLKQHYNFLHICHGVWGPDLVDYANRSRILLNIHAEDGVSWEPRVQMLMSTGNMVLSERITPNPHLKPGTDYIEIRNPGELYEEAVYYLEHEREREEIAKNGLKKIHALFDSRKVFSDFISDLMTGKYRKASFTDSRVNLILLKAKAGMSAISRRFLILIAGE